MPIFAPDKQNDLDLVFLTTQEKHDLLRVLDFDIERMRLLANEGLIAQDENGFMEHRYRNWILRIANFDSVNSVINYIDRSPHSLGCSPSSSLIKSYFPEMGDDVQRGNISPFCMQMIANNMEQFPVLMQNYCALVDSLHKYLMNSLSSFVSSGTISMYRMDNIIGVFKAVFSNITQVFSGFVPQKKEHVLKIAKAIELVLKAADVYIEGAKRNIVEEKERIWHRQDSPEYIANLEMFISVLNDQSEQLSMIQQSYVSEFVNRSGCEYRELVSAERYERVRVFKHVGYRWLAHNLAPDKQNDLDLVFLTTQEKHDLLGVLDSDIERMRLLANAGLIAQDENGFMGHRYRNWIFRIANLKSYVNDRLAGDNYTDLNYSVDLQKLISLMSDGKSTPLSRVGIPTLLMQYFFPQMGDDVQQGNISPFCMQMIGNNMAQFPFLMQNYCALVDFFHKYIMYSWSEYISRGTIAIYHIDNVNLIFKAVFSNITQVFSGFVPQKKEHVLKITKAIEIVLKAADVYIEAAKRNIVEEKERICHGQSSAEYLASLEMFISVLNDESEHLSMIQQACVSEFVNRSGCEYGELVGAERYERVFKHVEDKWLAHNQAKPTEDPSSTLVAGNAVAYSESCERGMTI